MEPKQTLCHLHILKAGLMTTLQDAGRTNYRAWGVPPGGYLDRQAAHTANALVGNDLSHPVLEMTIQGPTIQFGAACQIAITGANMSAQLDGTPIPHYHMVDVKAGSTLQFGRLLEGCRAYLAVGGQWQVEELLGSCSPLFTGLADNNAFGWVRKGDRIPVLVHAEPARELEISTTPPQLSSPLPVRVLPGPEFSSFSRYSIATFFSHSFQLSNDCNRMGLRLKGPQIKRENTTEMISSGVLPGTVQITSSGQAIVLLADAQTTGGYPRLVQIVDEDLDGLAQLKPGDGLRFVMYQA